SPPVLGEEGEARRPLLSAHRLLDEDGESRSRPAAHLGVRRLPAPGAGGGAESASPLEVRACTIRLIELEPSRAMPWGSLVIGSVFFRGRAKMRRRGRGTTREDFDAVECFFIFLLPLVPLRPVHVWDWGKDEATGTWLSSVRTTTCSFRSMPIRWSPYLVLRALLRYWLWLPMFMGFVCSLSCAHHI